MQSPLDLFILAAEPSGDLLGAELVQKLLEARRDLRIAAVAGPHLRALPVEPLFCMEELQVMGFIDILSSLPSLWRLFRKIRRTILDLQPRAVLCVDYPGFNLRLEASLRKAGYSGKLIHYVSPTVWAWGKKRIPKMAKTLDLLLTLFPFEKASFASTSLRVEYVGHPLSSKISLPQCDEEGSMLAIFPGSRRKEILRTFPAQLEAAARLCREDPDCAIGISLASWDLAPLLIALTQQKEALPITFFAPERKEELVRSAKVALATSGTITLELALHQLPSLVTYGISSADLFLAQKVFKIHLPHYCIVNILVAEELFPEFFGPNLTQDCLFSQLEELWRDKEKRKRIRKGCHSLRDVLQTRDSATEAAGYLLKII